ncbi:transposase, partial [Streptomyces rectiviolaceus]|uniref:transposase n=1 Tax=Streptomyces rectiviolaceus TaxID=332591 RepID=UPI003CD07D6A
MTPSSPSLTEEIGAPPRQEAPPCPAVDTGCKWSALPSDFPPFKTVFGFFSRWTAAGVFNLI